MSKVQLEIHTRAGGSFTVDVVEWKFKKDGLGKSLEWKTPPGARRRLAHVDLDEVAAIVEVTR